MKWVGIDGAQRDKIKSGCGDHEDSIEHFGCRVARRIGWKVLRLPEKGDYDDRKKNLLGAAKGRKEERTCWYFLAYAILKTTNRRRNNGGRGCADEELKQELRNAVEGDKQNDEVARGRWAGPAESPCIEIPGRRLART